MVPTLASGQLDKITLSELLGALSHALDLTEGQPAGHCVRCSRIGVEIGREIGLGQSRDCRTLLCATAEGSWLQQQRGADLRAVSDR